VTARRPGPSGSGVSHLFLQAAIVVAIVLLVALAAAQAAANLRARGIASGFEYLTRAAGFEIAEGPVPYTSRHTYARALAVGLVNTLRVSTLGIIAATALGFAIALARLSRIRILPALTGAYVEALRNTPLLLQLMFWYALSQALPAPEHAINPVRGVFLCNRGLFLPGFDPPSLGRFDFSGGLSISPEFGALLIALSTYTAAFIAEIVRGGILAVDKGQTEAALALGLSPARALRLVVLPQALRSIVPPMTGQFLNLTKNSSLAVAIGFPELMSVTGTTLNQTGQAIEAVAVAATIYLAIGLTISLAMNVYNRGVMARGARMP
jgi:general L-amino acid transport system permease protein